MEKITKALLPALMTIIHACAGANCLAQEHNPDLAKAHWIWTSPAPTAIGEWECYARKTFDLTGEATSAAVLITADNVYELYVNGEQVGEDGGSAAIYWQSVERYDVSKLLRPGRNVVAARAKSLGGYAGLLIAVRVEIEGAPTVEFYTDETWLARKTFDDGWNQIDYDGSQWPKALALHRLGEGPWGRPTFPGPVSPMSVSMLSWMEIGPDFQWPAGIVFVGDYVPLVEPANFTVSVLGSRAYFEHDAACPPALGRRLMKLVPAKPGGELTSLHDAGTGLVAAPCVSWDGRTVYFSMVRPGDKFFHVYSIGADGTNLTQLTDGPYHDYEPAQLPDGRIIFCSTRLGSRDEYHGNFASAIFAMKDDGSDITPITYHIVADHEPKVTAHGSIAFVRCDNFFERAKVETRIHHIRPDGAGGMAVLGPDRAAIGLDRTFAAERNSAWLRQNGFGSVAPLADGRIAAICQNGLVASGLFDSGASQFEKAPVGFVPFDVSPLPDGRVLCTGPGRSWIGLIDWKTGETAKILSGDKIHSPVFLGRQRKPPVLASQLPPNAENRRLKTGVLFCQSIFDTKQTNADLSRIKAVRIVQGKPFTLRSAMHRFDHIGVEGVELGTVPLAPDGSFAVEVPADTALSIQAIDAEGRSVINETTWIYVRPGERVACIGCHNQRTAAPPSTTMPMAARFAPARLLGQGTPHRFRANNAGNGGALNLQYDRFREAAAITLFPVAPRSEGPLNRSTDISRLSRRLVSGDVAARISAAQTLGVLRDRSSIPALVKALKDTSPQVRASAGLALAACGDRSATEPLLETLNDRNVFAAQAANIALENLTAHSLGFNPFRDRSEAGKWRQYLAQNNWAVIEEHLIGKLSSENVVEQLNSARALGHVGSGDGKAALRDFVAENPNASLRVIIAAIRSLGYLRDVEAIPLLTKIFRENMTKDPGNAPDLHELGWLQKPVYLTATAAEALGRIGSRDALRPLIESTPDLLDFWKYTFWCGDHSWLMGCQSSPIHYRILEAIDRTQPEDIDSIVPSILKSIPIDTDRALLHETDSYENLVARVVARSSRARQVLETCLSVLGEADGRPAGDLKDAVTASPPALSVLPHDPESRAAQIISIICLDRTYAPRLREVFNRYRAMEPSRPRSWVCFYIARVLGRLGDRESIDTLVAALTDDATEASFGYEDPPNVFVYKAMTPFYRAAAADALGRINSGRAVGALMETLTDFDNAVSVRNAAANALLDLSEYINMDQLDAIARTYPEVSTRRTLLEVCNKSRLDRASP
ncbi:MAG: HEAT repeat domain-containing protein [Planctomycetota bacterium]|jgi:HEAT repeat protein